MSPRDCSRKKGPYEIITDRIVAALEAGTVPWQKPWNSESIAPRSILGHRYRGVNVFVTAMAGYECPFWLTYKQARKMGVSPRVIVTPRGTPATTKPAILRAVADPAEDESVAVRWIRRHVLRRPHRPAGSQQHPGNEGSQRQLGDFHRMYPSERSRSSVSFDRASSAGRFAARYVVHRPIISSMTATRSGCSAARLFSSPGSLTRS